MTGIPGDFNPPGWCRNAHIQTLAPYLFRRRPKPPYRRERIELTDGDFIDLDWLDRHNRSLTIILHGLEGSAQSHYARGLSHALDQAGHSAVVMHFRGCSGEPNRLHRRYHCGDTLDIQSLCALLDKRFGRRAINAVGYSLGGSVLLNWLIESGEQTTLNRAAGVCVPVRLASSANRLNQGFSRLYQWHLIGQMRRRTAQKFKPVSKNERPFDLNVLRHLRTFHQFDDAITAPLHGFSGVDDYYQQCSVHGRLKGVRCPTLLLQSRDDPFMDPNDLASLQTDNPDIVLEITEHGGHVGFFADNASAERGWLDQRLLNWLLT